MATKRTAFFTGAGASKAIGYALTRELTGRILAQLRTSPPTLFDGYTDPDTDRQRALALWRDLCLLMPGFESADDADSLPLITDVFSLIEYAIVSGDVLPVGDETRLRSCRDLLRMAITAVLLDDFDSPYKSDPEGRSQERALDQTIRWFRGHAKDIALITTNYDIGIEYELYQKYEEGTLDRRLDLGFSWRGVDGEVRIRPADPLLRIYKLHGSLDTLRCRICGHVYFNPAGTIAHQAFRKEVDYGNTCVCSDDIPLELSIVSPSLVRDIRDANLLSIWLSAFEYLRQASRWVIVGYSLPPEDLAIRSLLMRAYSAAGKEKPEIVVVQQGDGERPRYQLLFGKCTYKSGGLEKFLEDELG